MLKTRDNGTIRLVTQPDHARVSGYMAAHWGNEEFTKLGFYDNCSDPDKLAAETIFGIAEHDNGWWEWEVSPTSSELDNPIPSVPLNPTEATQRWRIGTSRFEDSHPYASLLINFHAYRLYNMAHEDESIIHPLFGDSKSIGNAHSPQAISLTEILQNQQERLKEKLDNLGGWHKDAIRPEILLPHARMTQILDALSLYLCSDFIPPVSGKAKGLGRDEVELNHIPRKNWDDKVKLHITPQDDGTLVCDPYPFDENNLVVPIVVTDIEHISQNQVSIMDLYKLPKKIVSFTFRRP